MGLHQCKMGLHRCKTGLGWCKRLLGDFCFLSSKLPFAPSPNHFWEFTIFGLSPRTFGLQILRCLKPGASSKLADSKGPERHLNAARQIIGTRQFLPLNCLVDILDIFFFCFFCLGGGKEEASEEVAGGSVLIKSRGKGGCFRGGGVGGGRALGECLWGKVGAKKCFFFFRARNSHHWQDWHRGLASPQNSKQAKWLKKRVWRASPYL